MSLEQSSLCVISREGKIVAEGKALSEPEPLARWIRDSGLTIERVGLEAGPLSQWLTAGLEAAGFEVALLETRHVRAALSAVVVKTDRNDARGIAQLLRMGWFRPVHCKSISAQEVRAMLTARKQLLGKLVDLEGSTRGILRGFGLKVGAISRGRFLQRIRDLIDGHSLLQQVIEPLLAAREALRTEVNRLHRQLVALAKGDPVCKRLMTTPGVGALVALTYMSGVDDPGRFSSSRSLGPLPGAYAAPLSIRRDGHRRPDQLRRRRHGPLGAL